MIEGYFNAYEDTFYALTLPNHDNKHLNSWTVKQLNKSQYVKCLFCS